ncbi:class I SAM-dependent methyltransferase [Nonomuraea sp. 3N208]|uniref:class I SAM-dependent methyltransferase n=1 Tax=Nonomuraea sp. 3N208 TaxID=3457421 RepID=UPI003FD17AD4
MEFDEVYRAGRIPWDIGEPQPALAELVAKGWCTGHVLDIGCGTGELALALAAHGYTVMGVDLEPHAIELARRKAAEHGLDVDLHVADATEFDDQGSSFDTVLDSGLLHSLQPEAQARYLDVLRRVCKPGGRVAVLCFADIPGARTPGGRGLTEGRLRGLFADGWEIETLDVANILGIVPDGLGDMSEWPRDERGRTPMTGWLLRAHRVGS